MLRKIILVVLLMIFAAPVFADSITISQSPGGAFTLGTGSGSITAFCLQFTVPSPLGVPLNYSFSPADSSLTQIAWIAAQSQYSEKDRQNAIWHLTDKVGFTSDAALQLVNLSAQYATSASLTNAFVWSPVIPTKSQKFITIKNGADVPEPATLFLLGSGLAGIASLLKRRRR